MSELTPGGKQTEGSEETSRRLIEALSTHAIFKLDPDGKIKTWPEPAQTQYNYDPVDVLDKSVSLLFAENKHAEPRLRDLLDNAKDSSTEISARHCRADGSDFWATLTIEPLWDGQLHGYVVVSRDTTAQRRNRQRLERQNDRLKEFTDILAHDLRNPLSVIESRLLLYRATGQDSHLDEIAETTSRMDDLVEDLLQVAKHGAEVTNPDVVDLDRLIQTAWEGTGKQTTALALQTESVGTIRADPDRVCQLLENIFRNAVEHGGEAVTVQVGPLETGFYVADDGPGIPEELRDEVFDHGVTTSTDGTGYGLSIVRTIANAHGWDVTVGASDTGGARFEFTGIKNLRPKPAEV